MASHSVNSRRRFTAIVGAIAIAAGVGLIAPSAAMAAPPPAPADPVVLFQEGFENGTGAAVIGLTSYLGAQGATYTADPFWLDAAACNGLVLQGGADWSGAGAPCATVESRDRLMDLAGVLGGGDTANHIVAAYTDADGPSAETLLTESIDSGIVLTEGRFYVSGIDLAEVNCWATSDSTIAFGLILPSGEVMIDGAPAVVCNTGSSTTVGGVEIRYGSFYSAGFKASESGPAEYIARNLQTAGNGNDFAYDNLIFLDATPTLHKSFAQETVEVGQPVTMELTVVNTAELSEKTGWAFTDDLPTGMTIADTPNIATTCAAADVVADAGSATLSVENGSLASGAANCVISVDVVLNEGGEFTNVITNIDGLDGEPSATIRALVPSISLTKSVSPTSLTADSREAVYTFTVLNDGEVDLSEVTVTDPGPIGGTGTMGPIDCGGITDLAVDEQITCTAVYTAGLDDLNGEDLTNEASVSGSTPGGGSVFADAEASVATVVPNPQLSLVKTASATQATKVGQVITYNFVVTNTGNVAIDDIEVTEGSFSGKGTLGTILCPADAGTLAVGADVTCTAAYSVVAADLTGKPITNTATASGVGPFGLVESDVAVARVDTVVPGSGLATTGSESGLPLMLGGGALLLLLAGGIGILVARRRTTDA